MQVYTSKIICECGQKSIQEAIDIFKATTLPYKKSQKTGHGVQSKLLQ